MTADLNALPLAELYNALCRDEPGRTLLRRLLTLAYDEDLPAGDVTSEASVPPGATASAVIACRKVPGILCGVQALRDAVALLAPGCRITPLAHDGEAIAPGQNVMRLEGPARQVLALERLALNLVSRLSGVSTRTHTYVKALPRGSKARIYDTRKTTPGLRQLEKYAVRCGGGCLHRLNLSDALLIKDNHIAPVPAGELGRWTRDVAHRARVTHAGRLRFIEVEVDSADALREVLAHAADEIDIVLLDNMTTAQLAQCVALRHAMAPRVALEASGGVTLDTVAAIALTGVERISTGDLTHHAVSLDFGLDFQAGAKRPQP